MNVLLILCPDFWMIHHLVPSWKKIADNVQVFYYPGMAGWQTGEWPKIRRQKLSELKSVFSSLKKQLDLIFTVSYDDFLDQEFLQSAGNIPVINLHVDADTQWHRVLKTAKHYSLIVFTHRDPAVLSYMNQFTKVIYQPMGANPDYFKPLDVEKKVDVMFVGSHDAARGRILDAVCDVTDKVAVFGGQWENSGEMGLRGSLIRSGKRLSGLLQKSWFDLYYAPHIVKVKGLSPVVSKFFRSLERELFSSSEDVYSGRRLSGKIHGPLPTEDYVRVLNSARLVLGINQRGKLVSHRLRDMEIPSMGLMYTPQRFAELPELFQEGEEVISWADERELKNLLSELLRNQERMKRIGERARQRVIKDHTWEKRFRDMLAML